MNRYVDGPLTQNQFDALVDFTFNVGTGAFRDSTVLDRVNSGADSGAMVDAFFMWTKNGCCAERRLQEANMYNDGIYP